MVTLSLVKYSSDESPPLQLTAESRGWREPYSSVQQGVSWVFESDRSATHLARYHAELIRFMSGFGLGVPSWRDVTANSFMCWSEVTRRSRPARAPVAD